MTLDAAISTFGASLKAKLSSPAIHGAPEDQLRAPLERLICDLSEASGLPAVFRGDPDRVRARLQAIVAEARAAAVLPWDRDELRLHRTIVPQMVLWLPDEKAAQWCFDFEAELERLAA